MSRFYYKKGEGEEYLEGNGYYLQMYIVFVLFAFLANYDFRLHAVLLFSIAFSLNFEGVDFLLGTCRNATRL